MTVLVLLGLGAALLLAVGFVLQQHEAAEVPAGRLGPGLLLVLVRRPVWLGGILAMVAGQVLGAAALAMGSLVVVEPLLATNVLFALPMAALISRRWLTRGDWIGAVMLVGGLALFLLGGSPSEAPASSHVGMARWLAAAAGFLAVLLLLLVAARGRAPRTRAALLATAAGMGFGVQDFLTQHALPRLEHGVVRLLASRSPWALIVVAVVSLTLAQRAFALADLSASLPPVTLAEPVCGIALSVGLLGQPLPRQPLPLMATAAGLALMLAGVVLLTRSPLVVDPHGRRGLRLRGRDSPPVQPRPVDERTGQDLA